VFDDGLRPQCRACGRSIALGLPGGVDPPAPCPRCSLLLAQRMLSSEPSAPAPAQIGGYKILARLGGGGMGDVYLAEQPIMNRRVALKTIRHAELADEAALRRFREEVAILGQQKHPNIVTIYDGSGLNEDPPFFAMQWIDGGSLDRPDLLQKFRDPRKATALMISVAEAVQSAHESLVLHRDLKPANILIDSKDRPHVSDFGVAKLLNNEETELANTIVGALGFMSPEQAGATEYPLTTASDVYGLGATLYYLLTGRPPYEAKHLAALVELFGTTVPIPPRLLAPAVSVDLQRVCLAALEPNPARRYRTAAAFGEDLRRVQERRPAEPPNAPAVGLWRKSVCWAQRHPLLATAAVFGSALLLMVDIATFTSVRAQESTLRQSVLRTNAALASSQARAVLGVLEDYARVVQRAATDPAVQRYLTTGTIANPGTRLHDVAPEFDTVFVVAPDGSARARWPAAGSNYYELNFGFRDYFKGAVARSGTTEVYVSQAFHSIVSDDNLKFALSTPVYAPDGTQLGVFVATRVAASTLRDMRFADVVGSGQISAVLGPRELPETALATKSPQFTVVIHKDLAPGREFRIDAQLSDRLRRKFPQAQAGTQWHPAWTRPDVVDNYRDPILGGRWLAGIAAVGRTGYVVVVQTHYAQDSTVMTSPLAPYLGVLNLGLLLLYAVGVWTTLRRRGQ
jgi:tRNA A-37 threonylcarbamoyl transferase component Bud32